MIQSQRPGAMAPCSEQLRGLFPKGPKAKLKTIATCQEDAASASPGPPHKVCKTNGLLGPV